MAMQRRGCVAFSEGAILRRYRPGSAPIGDLAQTQRYLRQELARIEQAIDSVSEEFARGVGYGALVMSAPTAGADITAVWQPIDVFDSVGIEGVGVQYDLVNSDLALLRYGVWKLNVRLTLIHNVNASTVRTLSIRWIIDGVPGPVDLFTIPRSVEQSTNDFSSLLIVERGTMPVVGVEISSAPDVTSVEYYRASFGVELHTPYVRQSDAGVRGR